MFQADPTSFLKRYSHNVIFDEAQRAPELFSYLQGMVDGRDEPGSFIISGSQNFLLSKSVSQSLAGRVGILRLLPLSYSEIVRGAQRPESAWSWAYRGGYPRVIASDIDPLDFYPAYVETYLERDVRQELGVAKIEEFSRFIQLCALRSGELLNIDPLDFYPAYVETYLERDVRQELGVAKIEEFSRFIQLCALRSGELLNVSSLASDCGISPATANNWISILSSSYVIHLLRPPRLPIIGFRSCHRAM